MSGEDPWIVLRRFTDARIGLGRSGSALPTREVLKFSMAHAQARDAVQKPIDWTPIESGLSALRFTTLRVASAAVTRDQYLRRPDLGRRLSSESRQKLTAIGGAKPDIAIVIGDGLSSTGVASNAVEMLEAFQKQIRSSRWSVGPIILAGQARVALGDDAGETLGAKAVIVLIGERPGLSSPDSLGAYLTWAPRIGCKDGERNCISNIRKGGLSYDEAGFKLAWLTREAFRRELTGVELKDESHYQIESAANQARLT